MCGRRPDGGNARFRRPRLTPGQQIKGRYGGAFPRPPRQPSDLPLMIYLTDGFTGGGTSFLDFDVDVAPRRGMALLFQHEVLHEGCAVESGVKYVLRSDVMYAD